MESELDLRVAEEIAQPYQAALALDRGLRRRLGSYYTPSYLVDLVLQRTLLPALQESSLDQILNLRVVDLACGGGVFLVGALRRICEYCHAHFGAELEARWGDDASARLPQEVVSRCIFGYDKDPTAVELCRRTLGESLGLSEPDLSSNICVADSLHDQLGTFSLVIGNPPWGQKGYKFEASEKALLRKRYRCGRGTLDPFKLFVERGIELLSEGGRWGLVLPDIILLKNYELVRRLIVESCALEFVGVAGQAFTGVNLDTVVMCARKGGAPETVSVWHSVPKSWRESAPTTLGIEQSVLAAQPQARFNLYLTPERLRVLDTLRECPRLGERFEAHEGVHSGNCRDRLFVDSLPEAGAKLVVGGKEIAPYRLDWAGRYIDLGTEVIDREAGDYANLGRAEWHGAGKIVVRRTGDRVIAALDHSGFYVSNNMFVVLPRVGASEDLVAATTALLNSSFMTWYFRVVMPRTGRLFAELKICHLIDFPMPAGGQWVAPLAALAAEREVAGPDHKLDSRIDELVLDAFGFEPSACLEIATGGGLAVPCPLPP